MVLTVSDSRPGWRLRQWQPWAASAAAMLLAVLAPVALMAALGGPGPEWPVIRLFADPVVTELAKLAMLLAFARGLPPARNWVVIGVCFGLWELAVAVATTPEAALLPWVMLDGGAVLLRHAAAGRIAASLSARGSLLHGLSVAIAIQLACALLRQQFGYHLSLRFGADALGYAVLLDGLVALLLFLLSWRYVPAPSPKASASSV